MAEDRATTVQAPEHDHRRQRIESVQKSVEKLELEDRRAALLVDFAGAFHFRTSLAYFAERQAAQLVAELESALEFMEERQQGEIRVRVRDSGDGHALLQVTMADQPFILDTVQEALRVLEVSVLGYLHPIVQVDRDQEHRIAAVRPRTVTGPHESFLHFKIGALEEDAARKLEEEILVSLTDTKWAVADFAKMKAWVEGIAQRLSKYPARDETEWKSMQEAMRFLRWALQENFVFLGCRSYRFIEKQGKDYLQVVPGSGLGVQRDASGSAFSRPVALSSIEEGLRRKLLLRVFPLVSKGDRVSRVHRRSHMDFIEIKEIGDHGNVVGEHRITGLFTAKALQQLCSEIPVLRQKLNAVLEQAEVLEGSHEYKHIVRLFNSIPKSELFATSVEQLGRVIGELIELQRGTEVRLSCHADIAERGISVMVILPRERFNAEIRKRVQKALSDRFGVPPVDYRLVISDEPFARFHFYFPIFHRLTVEEIAELESLVAASIRRWEDDFHDALLERFELDRAHEFARRYLPALPEDYRVGVKAVQAARDVELFERVRLSNAIETAIDNPETDNESSLLRILRPGDKYLLSDLMPVLTSLGLVVVDESTYVIENADASSSSAEADFPPCHLHTFRVRRKPSAAIPVELHGLLNEAIVDVLGGRYENDELGALVLDAGLSIRQVELLRTFYHYLRQIGAPHTRSSTAQALGSHPRLTRLLVEYFKIKFDPKLSATPEERVEGPLQKCRAKISAELDAVTDIGEDRILRGPLNVIDASVRTNYFQNDGRLDRVALKIESGKLSGLPRPVPRFEIFIQSAELEGVHLRSGRVARGGIRWSDRRDDFRTEILGLMRTQVTKNSVIVPVGSKGGFVLKTTPATREELIAEVEKQYRTYISGLLDLTDTRDRSKIVPPKDTVRYDGDDPYLVVAADRGTAQLSDVGNEIARQYGFWLDDAFASGGTQGYDHKKYGITARGAWECVRHLFREFGVDVDRDRFTVAGIGDMSGDVFGNGMLLSRNTCLVAAFDHRNIFIDPTPDPERTFQERERLFNLPRSSWEDFDPDCLSAGAGIFSRHAKRIDLSPEIRQLLDTDATGLSSEELVRAILCLDVDLIYNGGIGTYVKASHEHHSDAHDERNDAVRVDACELRCKIIGEGGNLGLTQAARVEFARLGGRVNTDFVDNSGGVDLSDHEVNVKIALGELRRQGKLDLDDRNALLREIAPDVVDLVLETNRSQAQILSLEELDSSLKLADHLALLGDLQTAQIIDPDLDQFPGAGELAARKEEGLGLLRPELATLMSFTKISIFEALVSSELVDSAAFEAYFRAYFPEKILSACGPSLRGHPLRAEIAATVLTNEIVHRCGLTTIARLRRDLGSTVESLARAYHVVDHLLQGSEFFAHVEREMRGGAFSSQVAYDLIEIYRDTLADIVAWLVRNWPLDDDRRALSVDEVIGFLRSPFKSTTQWISETAPEDIRERVSRRRDDVLALGVSIPLAETVANFSIQREIPPIFFMAARLDRKANDASAVYAMVRNTLRLEAVLGVLNDLPVTEPDDFGAARALKEQFRTLAVSLASRILELAPAAQDLEEAVGQFFSADWSTFEDYLGLVDSMLTDQNASLGSFVILSERLRRLSDSRARG